MCNQMFQSTHPHGVRRLAIAPYRLLMVSIHAPTRGATLLNDFLCFHISCFNPRTHTGCDTPQMSQKILLYVSIHAPTRGATIGCVKGGMGYWFQSTHPHGVRLPRVAISFAGALFQSTHPHGVRLLKQKKSFIKRVFQSTHPHGVRLYNSYLFEEIIFVSIHAPTRGATLNFAFNSM